MPRSSRSKTKPNYEMLQTSAKLDKIDACLQMMLDRFPSKGVLSPEEIQDWHKDLTPFSSEAIDYAFETHRRNAIFFPLAGQILDLCISYDPPQYKEFKRQCDAICRARHGKGYGTRDMIAVLIKLDSPMLGGKRKTPATEEEIEKILAQIDRKRHGGAPEWRRQSAISES